METELFNALITLGHPVVPLAPDSDDQNKVKTGKADLPLILYRRKLTETERCLDGSIAWENIDVEIEAYGNTFQEASGLADDVVDLLDNETFNGFYFTLNNRFANEQSLDIIHLWFSVWVSG